jgi:hypothetical protein
VRRGNVTRYAPALNGSQDTLGALRGRRSGTQGLLVTGLVVLLVALTGLKYGFGQEVD